MLLSAVEGVEAFEGEFTTSMADTWIDDRYQSQLIECSAIHKSVTGNIEAIDYLSSESASGVTKAQSAAASVCTDRRATASCPLNGG